MVKLSKIQRIIIASLIILIVIGGFNYFGCSRSPEQRSADLSKALLGHWVSENGRDHLYFSEKNRMIHVNNGVRIVNTIYSLAWYEGPESYKFVDAIFLNFVGSYTGWKRSYQITFSRDKKTIYLSIDRVMVNNDGPDGVFSYSDERREP